MRKNVLAGLSVVVASVLFTGCGGGGSGSASSDTGTGTYVDSAVEGVEYRCGSQSGFTDANGTFTFEKKKGCTFSVAGVSLRTTSPLSSDGVQVIEGNETVARLLQSIDLDGNPDNGIQITKEMRKVLDAQKEKIKRALRNDTEALGEILKSCKDNISDFNGTVKTPEDVKKHLAQTIKQRLAGKTLYMMDPHDYNAIDKVVINSDATSATWEQIEGGSESGIADLNISGATVHYISSSGAEGEYKVLEVTNRYILTKEHFNLLGIGNTEIVVKRFFNLEDARNEAKALLSGKTLYIPDPEDQEIEKISINHDVTSANVEIVYGEDKGEKGTVKLRTFGNLVYITEPDEEEETGYISNVTDKYIEAIGYDDGYYEKTKYYFSLEDAKKAMGNGNFSPAHIDKEQIANKKITFHNGSAFIEIKENNGNYQCNLKDISDSSDGQYQDCEIGDSKITIWAGKSYEYTMEFGSSSIASGTKLRVKGEHTNRIDTISSISPLQ